MFPRGFLATTSEAKWLSSPLPGRARTLRHGVPYASSLTISERDRLLPPERIRRRCEVISKGGGVTNQLGALSAVGILRDRVSAPPFPMVVVLRPASGIPTPIAPIPGGCCKSEEIPALTRFTTRGLAVELGSNQSHSDAVCANAPGHGHQHACWANASASVTAIYLLHPD